MRASIPSMCPSRLRRALPETSSGGLSRATDNNRFFTGRAREDAHHRSDRRQVNSITLKCPQHVE